MTEDLNHIDSIILRHLTGAADQNEKELLLSWLKESDANKKYFFNYKALWEASQNNTDNLDTDRSWFTIIDKMNNKPVRKMGPRSWLKYAAAIVLLAGFAIGLYMITGRTETNKTVVYTEIRTVNGQKKEVTLTDGTKVWLNSGTYFKYADNYGETNREVYLQGEAFFEVMRDTTSTFIVLTDNVTIKVLGTSFNVNCYPDLDQVETTVISGVVSVENAGQDEKNVIILNKREKGTFLKDQNTIHIEKDSSSDALAGVSPLGFKKITLNEEGISNAGSWKDRTLVFDNETFEEMAVKLHRWFNVEITIKDENLKNYRYKGKFDDVKSVYQVLEVIRLTTPFNYEYNEKTKEITINK